VVGRQSRAPSPSRSLGVMETRSCARWRDHPAVGPAAGHDGRHTSVIPVLYRLAARPDGPSNVVRQMQSMGDCVANGRLDLTGHVILIVEEQPIVALNMQIAAEEAGGEAINCEGTQ